MHERGFPSNKTTTKFAHSTFIAAGDVEFPFYISRVGDGAYAIGCSISIRRARALLADGADRGLFRRRPLTMGFSVLYLSDGSMCAQFIRGFLKPGRYCTSSTNSQMRVSLSLMIFGICHAVWAMGGGRFNREFSRGESRHNHRSDVGVRTKPVERRSKSSRQIWH